MDIPFKNGENAGMDLREKERLFYHKHEGKARQAPVVTGGKSDTIVLSADCNRSRQAAGTAPEV
jgi:hypothetical protein